MRSVAGAAFDRVADTVASHAWRELDPVRVATDGRKTGDTLGLGVERRVVKRLLRRPIRREMDRLRGAWTGQYHVLLDGVADDGASRDEVRERFVAADPFLDHYEGTATDEFADALRGHHDRLADAIAPIVANSPSDGGAAFWELATRVHDAEELRDLLDDLAGHGPILAEYRDGIAFTMAIEAPVVSERSVEYGDEAVRVIREGIAAARAGEERRMERVLEDRS